MQGGSKRGCAAESEGTTSSEDAIVSDGLPRAGMPRANEFVFDGSFKLYDDLTAVEIEGSLARRLQQRYGDQARIINGDGTATVGSARLPAGSNGTAEVTYGIRPEHLSFGNEGDGLKATVDVVEPTGADTMVVARVDGGDQLVAGTDHHEVQIVLRDRVAVKSGDTVWLKPDASRVHLFDAGSGKRLG